MVEEPEIVRAVGHAYLLGVSSTSVLLWLWLFAATGTLLRLYRRSATLASFLAGVYILVGYVGYLLLLDPITIWFMSRVAFIEPFVLHPAWVRVVVPTVSFVAWLFILHFARRRATALTAPEEATP